MLARTFAAVISGIDAQGVEVEANILPGNPAWALVGMPQAAVREVRERIRAAMSNSGISYPDGNIVVNLAPADLRKEGALLDLPVALALLGASGTVPPGALEQFCCVGEVGLDGTLRPGKGMLSAALHARTTPQRKMLVPLANATEAALARGVEVYAIRTLSEAVDFLQGKLSLAPVVVDPREIFRQSGLTSDDLRDIKGQEQVKRAMEVAAAGGHNVLLIGPPGSGKTMISSRLNTILPPMTFEESLETTRIHSVAGMLSPDAPIVARRPFRSPHHTVSEPGLVGGGSPPTPGEISLAHHGVLFLDEFPEFRRGTLEVLRQPLETGEVTVARAQASLTFPARFILVAAMNPTPSGFFADDPRCTNSPMDIQRYVGKISGPLLDRIDIQVEVQPVSYQDLQGPRDGESSDTVRERVTGARAIQTRRYEGRRGIFCNAHIRSRELEEFCRLDSTSQRLLENAVRKLNLSARAYDRILKLARTIADLEAAESIESPHIAEAIQYRSLDRRIM